MEIKKDGIHRHIESIEWGHYQKLGYEKVVVEPSKDAKEIDVKVEEKPQDVVVDDLILEKEPVIKPKKTKKLTRTN